MDNGRLDGVSLLALYGERPTRRNLGRISNARQFKKNTGMVKTYRSAENPELLGAFLPGLMKPLKKIGKVTSGMTTAAASVFVPKSTLSLVSKLDPTKKKVVAKVTSTKPSSTVAPVAPAALSFDAKKVAIVGGSAVGALLVLKLLFGSKKRVPYAPGY